MPQKKAALLFTKQPQISKAARNDPFLLVSWTDVDLLFSSMIADVAETLGGVPGVDIIIYTHDEEFPTDFLSTHARLDIRPQQGENFYESVQMGVENAFHEGYQRILAFLEPVPLISAQEVQRAFAQLTIEDDCIVYGPLNNADYYLVGMKHNHSVIFRDTIAREQSSNSSMMEQLCACEAMLIPLDELYVLDSGYALLRLREDVERRMSTTANFPRHTAEMFKLIQRKYKLKQTKR